MNLAEWRARQAGEEYTLPSGLDVKLKQVSLVDLAQGGRIPQTLRAPVDEIMKMREGDRLTVEDLQKFAAVVDLVAELDITELPFGDRQSIFSWANAQADALMPFRRQQGGDVESSFSVGELRATT
jgi:virulence-associated protein VagC